MKLPEYSPELEKKDYWVALLLAVVALAAYVRTLAPDVLYGDSAEFQTLAYTLGITHSTGYPTYLLLGRFIGFLPIHSPAWRINLLSAVDAALTVAGVYLLARYFTRSRAGAVLGGVALGLSYTFWSQAVIAEVYTTGTAFIVVITLLLFHWQADPTKRNRVLLAAALLTGIGFGVHASVWLLAPPAVALVIWTLWWRQASRSEWLRALTAGFAGAVVGLAIFVSAFLVSYKLDPPTSFVRTSLEPSRAFWNLKPADFDSPFSVLKMTVLSVQWGSAEFSSQNGSFEDEFKKFTDQLTELEFSPIVILVALAGAGLMAVTQPIRGLFLPLAFLVSLFFILNYQVEDKYVFYLSLYIPFAVAVGTGIGYMLEWIQHWLDSVPDRRYQWLNLFPVLFFATVVIQPVAAIRWRALQSGVADFVTDDYQYPVKNLREPRFVAQMQLAGTPPNAVFVLEWRELFATAYVGQVEKHLTDTLFLESLPHGDNGKVASTLITQLKGYLQEGRPVYTDQSYPGLDEDFRLLPTAGNLYKLSLKK
jgi:transmembrane protein TMEM260 (protein O-mannosyltransferase)